MRVGAYQFAVTGDMDRNYRKIERALHEAKGKEVKFLFFPECSLTGYPPRDLGSSAEVDFAKLSALYSRLQGICDSLDIYALVGTITRAQVL